MARALPKNIFDLTVIKETLSIVWEASPRHTIIRITLVFLNAILPFIPIYLFKLLLDAFASGQQVNTNHIIWILVAMGLVSLFTILINNISAYNNSIQSDIITDHMAALLINKSLTIDMEFYDSDKYHDQFSRAMGQGGTKPLAVLNGVTSFFQNLITLLAVLALLITLHWSIIFILFIISVPSAYVRFVYSEKLVQLTEEQTQPGRITGYYKSVLTGKGSAMEVRMFAFGNYLLEKFLNLAKYLRKERRQLYFEQLRWVSFAQSGQVITIIFALGFISYSAINGNMSVGDISMYYMVFQKGQNNLSGLMNSAISLHKQKLTLNYLFEFLGMESKVLDPPTPTPIPENINSVQVENLSFIYPETEKLVLDNISFNISKGELVAIVGENGSGKTTLVKLINRLYDPVSGSISYNNINNKEFAIEDIRRKITVIFQKFMSYALTVKDNITLSNVFQEADIKKIKEAATYAQADKFIEALPLKYDSQLGRNFKNGHELSKGQWQKIALSRAFYKNGDLIILDEPTSFIDPISEEEIFNNFKLVAKDKILVLITHRIYNLKMADKILVLDKGKLVESGNHDSLMQIENGLYKKMFETQNIDD